MKKYRCYLDFEKEEQWLNEMAKQGWALTRKFLWYEFREGVPNDSAIKIDYHTFKTKDDFERLLYTFQRYRMGAYCWHENIWHAVL